MTATGTVDTAGRRIYLSGPISLGGTTDPAENLSRFAQAAERLRGRGFLPVSPDIGQRPGWRWTDYMRACIALLLTCDGVAMLPGWEHSKGACTERSVALAIGLPVALLEQWVGDGDWPCCGNGCDDCPNGPPAAP